MQAGPDAVFKVLDLIRSAICGNDDLLVLIHKRVERVEEFFLRAVLARDELHVIDHQHVDRAEQFLEVHHLAVAQGLYEPVHELFGRQVQHVQMRMLCAQLPGDGVHEVRFAKTNAAIEEKRVEGDRAAFGHAARCGMGQFVRLADDKAVEGEPLVEGGAVQRIAGCGGRGRFLRFGNGGRCLCTICDGFLAIRSRIEHHPPDHGVDFRDRRQNHVAIILRYVVAKEVGGDFECHDAVVRTHVDQRFYPALVAVAAKSIAEFIPNCAPLFAGHVVPVPIARMPCDTLLPLRSSQRSVCDTRLGKIHSSRLDDTKHAKNMVGNTHSHGVRSDSFLNMDKAFDTLSKCSAGSVSRQFFGSTSTRRSLSPQCDVTRKAEITSGDLRPSTVLIC